MTTSTHVRQSPLRTALAGLIGNVLEWFDFAVYGYFASNIGHQFFPQSDPAVQTFLTFATFAAGFLARPIGSVLLGRRTMFAIYFAGSAAAIMATFGLDLAPEMRLRMYFLIGLTVFGVFGSFTYYLPELFPTRLRGTGAGFCYNIGRIVTAGGVVVFGIAAVSQKGAQQGDLRLPLLYGAFLLIPAMIAALLLPDLKDAQSPTQPVD